MCHMLRLGGRAPAKVLFAKNSGRVINMELTPTYNEKTGVRCVHAGVRACARCFVEGLFQHAHTIRQVHAYDEEDRGAGMLRSELPPPFVPICRAVKK